MPELPLKWAKRAQADRKRIAEFYADEASPFVADEALSDIKAAAEKIKITPLAYRAGKRAGTRELVMHRFPFVLIYRILPTRITLLRVLHQARRYFN
jgi:addiction module RelE/StbE family toxin